MSATQMGGMGIGAGSMCGTGFGELTEARAENAMLGQEMRQQNQANFDAATGNFIGAACNQANANTLDRARNSIQQRNVQSAEQQARTDLAFGDIAGYMRE